MSDNLLGKIHRKNKLHTKCRKQPNNLCMQKKYSELSKEVAAQVTLCKERYYSQKFKIAKGDLKKECSIINEFFSINVSLTGPILLTIWTKKFTLL